MVVIFENLIGSSTSIMFFTLSIVNPTSGLPIASSTALITSTAILFTKNYIKKIRYTKLRDCKTLVSLLFEKTLKQPMRSKNIQHEEAQDVKRFIIFFWIKELTS